MTGDQFKPERERQGLDRGASSPTASRSDDDLLHSSEVASVIRSEEELQLATRAVERETVRLVKYIVTETITTTTEVRREELRVERVAPGEAPAPEASPPDLTGRVRERVSALRRRVRPTTAVLGGQPFGDEALEIILMEEQVVVTKRVVPRERVRLRKETITEQRELSESLRKEQVWTSPGLVESG